MWLLLLVVGVAAFFLYKRYTQSGVPTPKFLGRVPQKKHAVVIGAGMGGICTARVLSQYFKKVTVVDRDNINFDAPSSRSGVPQGKQLHGLLARGCVVADTLFPGLVDEWLADGAPLLDVLKEFKFRMNGCVLPDEERKKDGKSIYGIGMSRPFVEFHLRRRLLQDCPNVSILPKTTALGLIYDKDTSTVTGVKIKRKSTTDECEGDEKKKTQTVKEDLAADFVAFSAGRKNQLRKWLEEIGVIGGETGVELPEESNYPGLGYSTSRWRPPPGWLEEHPDFNCIEVAAPSPSTYSTGIVAFRIEKGEYGFLAFGYGKNYPPTNTKDVIEYLKPTFEYTKATELQAVLEEWEQTGDWVSYHDERNVLHHFEKLGARWPQNFVALGDTVATFNPSFGQGMTHALMHVHALKDTLHNHFTQYPVHDLTGVSLKFQQAAATVSSNFWIGVECSDLQWPTTEGERSRFKDFMGRFQRHLWRIACENRDNMFNFVLMTNGINGPEKLFTNPTFVFPALYGTLKEVWEAWRAQQQGKQIEK